MPSPIAPNSPRRNGRDKEPGISSMCSAFRKMGVLAFLALGLTVAMADPSQAANRIEGAVAYSSGRRYGYAVGATVIVVNTSTRKTDRHKLLS
jgi:hypothetical protein